MSLLLSQDFITIIVLLFFCFGSAECVQKTGINAEYFFFFFFFKQKTAYEIMPSLVGSEMCIRDRYLLFSLLNFYFLLFLSLSFFDCSPFFSVFFLSVFTFSCIATYDTIDYR
eukprot:TRINITY_DN5999_c0_g2_i2.p3 TRINITY_DN5999_c0_g2~~TRINITY_DN5999_c0_g2_i2.p3  ORF type:complete len:113 (-),score=15.51 TRINITY_DN5999_c0_g2_i2:173-511(-)